MKPHLTTLHNRNNICEMTEPVYGRKPGRVMGDSWDSHGRLPGAPPSSRRTSKYKPGLRSAGGRHSGLEWAHAIAPGAKILLVVASDSSYQSMFAAVDYAVNAGANVVSMSWSGSESATEVTTCDAHFNHPGVTFVASSGDGGELSSGVLYPAASPYVLSVGGTTLSYNNGSWSETAWSGSGGGISLYETVPVFQNGWQQFATGNMRSVPDVSYVGGPSPGVAVYVTPYGGWIPVGGTSVGAPQWSALIALSQFGARLRD